MKCRVIAAFFILCSLQSFSQCTIGVSLKKICLGATTVFTPNPATSNDSAFAWNFGDGSSSTQISPTYQYAKAGTYTVTLRIYAFGGSYCEATPVVVNVFDKPTAKYNRISTYAQCFNTNSFLFTDVSQPGVSNAPIKQRTIVYDDGAFDLDVVPYQQDFSHTYSNITGGKYKVVLEVKDTNDCIDQYIDSVLVHPKTNDVRINVSQNVQCTKTDVELTHNGAYDATTANKITWILGNGDTLYAPWNNLSYTYISQAYRLFKVQVVIEDKNGCIIRSDSPQVFTASPDSVIQLYQFNNSCFNNNLVAFGHYNLYHTRKWIVTLNGDTTIYDHNAIQTDSVQYHSFKSCGKANIRLEYNYLNCRIVTDTPVFIHGPAAFIENDTLKTRNKVQCTISDTVFFRVPDINCYYGNNSGNMHYLWNFDDPFAPACTTNTKFGLNVNQNCNFSQDSVATKHYYAQPGVRCYEPNLWVIDSTRNCQDFDTTKLRLTPPDAGWDSTSTPVRRGVYYTTPDPCQNIYTFHFDQMVPACIPDTVWLLPDSACTPQTWIMVSAAGKPVEKIYFYPKVCQPNAQNKLTYGVVATNGKDGSGRTCYDTAWYPLYYVSPPSIDFTVQLLDTETCAPFNVRLQLKDSVQKKIKQLVWNLGTNTPNVVQNFSGPNDTLVNPVFVTYNADGSYFIRVIATDLNGCETVASRSSGVGKGYSYANNKPSACVNDEISFSFNPFYLSNNAGQYWQDTARSNAGKEQIYWNFGDDTTWVKGFVDMTHTYTTTGIYQVSMAFKDSALTPCWDTIVLPQMIVDVSQILLNASVINDTFFCAPTIVTYTDLSTVKYSDGLISAGGIVSRLWNFGPDKPTSNLEQPAVFYPQNGSYNASLQLESVQGCKADTNLSIIILGPEPRFVIANDTIGCAPYLVILDNTTQKKLRNWIWYFNDANNSIKSTQTDSNVSFVYTKPGIYRIDLVGEDEIYNSTTGTTTNCTEKFPYLSSPVAFHSRQVVVLATDTLTISSKDTVCPEQVFTVTVGNAQRINQVTWAWGTGDSTIMDVNQAASYDYDTTGTYLIKVEPIIVSDTQCVAPQQKTIYVIKPQAGFDFDPKGYPVFSFTNKSTKAVRYIWDFGQPNSGENTSTLKDPIHNYGNENKQFTVCLMAFDANDCMDSVCKVLPVRSSVKIPNVFTPDNKDGKNDAFDIDIEGWEKYDLVIYNRWGTKVFEGTKDGLYNDGINWNGKNKNEGEPCPEGVYYIIFKYKLLTSSQEEVYHGTVTLIRE